MATMTDHLVDEFAVGELVVIAEYLRLAPVSDWGPRRCVDAILRKIRTDGVPALPPAEASEPMEVLLVRDFLYVAEIVDETGSVIEVSEPEGGDDESKGQTKHPCYSLADDRDPACARCPGFPGCAEERVAQLPACFGRDFDPQEQECTLCIEAVFCKSGMQ